MKTLRFSDWSTFAWYGIQLRVPSSWNPGQLIGDPTSGNARLDDAEIVRMEIEWKDARGDDRVSELLDRYTEGLAKEAEKRKRPLRVERHLSLEGLDLENLQPAEYFAWETGSRVHALACYSAKSDRFLFLRVMGRADEDLSATLPEIFNSLRDTPPDEAHFWSLYDTQAVSPAGYLMDTYELKSGHIRLRFLEGKRQIQFDRLSLGRSLLKSRTLADWYEEFFRKDHRHSQFEIREMEWQGKPSIEFDGEPRGRFRALLQPIPFWNPRPSLLVKGRAWFDEGSNKIHVVHTLWKKGSEPEDLEALCLGVVSSGLELQTVEA